MIKIKFLILNLKELITNLALQLPSPLASSSFVITNLDFKLSSSITISPHSLLNDHLFHLFIVNFKINR